MRKRHCFEAVRTGERTFEVVSACWDKYKNDFKEDISVVIKNKRKPRKMSDLSGAEKKAWKAFSEYIRRKDADRNGIVRCVTCSRPYHWKRMDAGHYVKSTHKLVKFDEMNVHAQCVHCNKALAGAESEYREYIIEHYGVGELNRLEASKGKICKRTVAEFKEIEELYKQKIKGLS